MRKTLKFLAPILLLGLLISACEFRLSKQVLAPASSSTVPKKNEEMMSIVALTPTPQPQEAQTINVDFGITIDPPLVKKFDFMNSGIATMERYRRDINLLENMDVQSLRIDLFWGSEQINGWKKEMVAGTLGNLQYDFTEIDELSRMLKERGIAGYWSYCYNPIPLQNGSGYATQPTDLEKWAEILAIFASHFREADLQPAYQAIWNEPDLPPHVFYNGSLEDYEELYRYGVNGLRMGDPDAFVGGPDLAVTQTWISPFLDFVEENRLPLDFFAFHSLEGNIDRRIGAVRAAIQNRHYFDTTGLVLSEYNLQPVNTWSDPNGPTTRYTEAALILETIKSLVDQPDIIRAHWAQFMDSGVDTLGTVSLNGHRRAAYHAFKLYAMMPVDRRQVSASGSISSIASTDGHIAGVLIWNLSGENQFLQVSLNNLPFTNANLKVYRIDVDHSSYSENPAQEDLIPEETKVMNQANRYQWKGEIPLAGVIYLELSDGTAATDQVSSKPVAKLIRTNRYFPDRTKKNFAEFDVKTWTIRLGMGPEETAISEIGLTLEEIQPTLNISICPDGQLQRLNNDSILAFRIDYQVADQYTYSVLFHDGLYNPMRTEKLPWGTKRQADKIIKVDNLGLLEFAPADYAPNNWNGRAILSFVMQNTGPHTRAKVIIRK